MESYIRSMRRLFLLPFLPLFLLPVISAEPGLTAPIDPRDKTQNQEPAEPADKSQVKDGSGKDSWFPVGYNKDRVAIFFVRLKTYEPLNENSFRLQAQVNNREGRIDINCKNKDYYFRPNGVSAQRAPWAVIAKGSGTESVAKFFCKRTAAKADWGYTTLTSYLWDIPRPTTDPSMAEGEWILFYDRDDGEAYYNDAVSSIDGGKMFAMWTRSKKGERSAATPGDSANYYWLSVSCTKNLGSAFVQLDRSVEGEWLAPVPGRPGGAGMVIRKKYCN